MIRRQSRREIDEQDRRERSMLARMGSPRAWLLQMAIGVVVLVMVALLKYLLA